MRRATRGNNKRRRIGFLRYTAARRRRRRRRGKNRDVLARSLVVALQSDFLARRSIRSASILEPLCRDWGKSGRYWMTMTTRRQKKRATFRNEKRTSNGDRRNIYGQFSEIGNWKYVTLQIVNCSQL